MSDVGNVAEFYGDEEAFEALLAYLRDSRGFDFTGYKRASLGRRIHRRMSQVGAHDYYDYLDLLQAESSEFGALFNTILINVTGFFRDPDTWSHLRDTAIPALLEQRTPDAPLRVWSAGCATGAEAYSMAIVLAEILGADRFRRQVKIYATDVDDDALTAARQAAYTESELAGLPLDLRERYFEIQGSRWSFRADMRRAVVFGRNDLVQDAPISRIDILTCRNTLMYFTPPTQSAILGRFQFALNPTGLLVLGKAEMLLNHTSTFEPIDLARRIFRKSAVNGTASSTFIPPIPVDRRRDTGPLEGLREKVFDSGSDAQLILTADDTVAMINSEAERLFGVNLRDVGRPLRDLVLSYRPVELRAAIEQARLERTVQRIDQVSAKQPDGERLWFEVTIRPLTDGDGRLLGTAVTYQEITTTHRLQVDLEQANAHLSGVYEELQSTGEELETTNEELQSTVEELETTNEELQSTNEELETTNEELRSTNDELQRINNVGDERTARLARQNSFLQSILGSLHSAIAVLDSEMRVTVWNDRAADLWGLREDEVVGQHLLNIDIGLPVERLRPVIRASLSADSAEYSDKQVVDAVNRRGRGVRIQIRTFPLFEEGAPSGTILLMETLEP